MMHVAGRSVVYEVMDINSKTLSVEG